MTNSSSFKRVSSSKAKVSAPQSPALSSASDASPKPRGSSAKKPAARKSTGTGHLQPKARAPILEASDASDDDLDASAGYESDGISAVIQTLMQKTQQKEKASAKKAESAAAAARTEALKKAEEAIRAAKAIADKEIHAAQQSCERKIQQETKRHRAAADALDSSLKELLADVAKATKSIKTAKKESDKEIDDCKRAGQRVLATRGQPAAHREGGDDEDGGLPQGAAQARRHRAGHLVARQVDRGGGGGVSARGWVAVACFYGSF